VRTDAGAAYRVFTPYYRRWLDQHRLAARPAVASERAARAKLASRDAIGETRAVPEPQEFGFRSSDAIPPCSEAAARRRLERFARDRAERYARDRDVPALDGTSRLSADLRAGTIGIRTCVASAASEKWLAELAWRDFYQAILREFPHVATGPFVESARRIDWRNDRADFDAWREGRTGYPIVDAAMLQLARTGWMHNRLRMIVASFLTKDLLIDWRWGERHFERSLADAELASNNGGWQWAASTGTDAVPYFRIFNPVKQGETFDPGGTFVRRMLPELARVPDRFVHAPWLAGSGYYRPPIVDHDEARKRAIATYAAALGKAPGRA
jgi:deoxyribodipyrimidine photo-lyase